MSAISSVGSQPMQIQQAPPAAKPVDHDGDHDNDATESSTARTQESSGPQRALNVMA